MGELFAGRYRLLDHIGDGGMGSLWRAQDLKQDRLVAAKLMRQADSSSLLRFVREQGLRINHPHVVMPLGWAAEDNEVLFTMPIVAGGSVATLVGDFGPLPPLFVAEVLRQMASALIAVHDARLVHRDVKPANILLDATGTGRPHAYLSDFGIAVELDGPRFTETGLVTGTPGYLAPALAALEDPAPSSDAFSLGAVGLHMLTARRPQDIAPTEGPPAGVPGALWETVQRLTELTPETRLSVPDALAWLATPELAWQPHGIGEIDVFDHLDHIPQPSPDSAPTAVRAAPTVAVSAAPPARASRTRDLVVFGFFGLLALIGLVLLFL